jgi:small subunit ribosomal protein S17
MSKRKMGGVVKSCYQNKCIVSVEKVSAHPKYKKMVRNFVNFAAAMGDNVVSVGEKVEIQECPPVSKSMKWVVVRKVTI